MFNRPTEDCPLAVIYLLATVRAERCGPTRPFIHACASSGDIEAALRPL